MRMPTCYYYRDAQTIYLRHFISQANMPLRYFEISSWISTNIFTVYFTGRRCHFQIGYIHNMLLAATRCLDADRVSYIALISLLAAIFVTLSLPNTFHNGRYHQPPRIITAYVRYFFARLIAFRHRLHFICYDRDTWFRFLGTSNFSAGIAEAEIECRLAFAFHWDVVI